MNVVISSEDLRLERVWYDAATARLCVQAGTFVSSIDFARVPDADFATSVPVKAFSIGQDGGVVICHHVDGEETWLPADLWLPGGFTP